MRLIFRWASAIALVLAGWAAPPPLAFAANLDTAADRVFGQPDFTHNVVNNGGLSAISLYANAGVALDAQGNLYVADTNNNRVLQYNAPLSAGATADRVFGQPDFTHSTANNGGISANSLVAPNGVALDAQGNLYVADSGNNRVLVYDAPLSLGATADHVFGQPDFTHNSSNNGGISANSLSFPASVALDAQGNLYVADGGNSRVLEYDAPLTTDRTAERVFGQPDFTHSTVNNGGVSATSLYAPSGVALDAQGNLYVGDTNNHRVLEYNAPLTTDPTADHVFGQPDMDSNTINNGGLSAASLHSPRGVAVDALGNLYVADHTNNRVLKYNTPRSAGTTADRVFGQPDFTHNTANNGGISASSLSTTSGVALDAQGNLYVADYGNSRVLQYDWVLFTIRLPLVAR